jgi:hypothetical protein
MLSSTSKSRRDHILPRELRSDSNQYAVLYFFEASLGVPYFFSPTKISENNSRRRRRAYHGANLKSHRREHPRQRRSWYPLATTPGMFHLCSRTWTQLAAWEAARNG